MFAVQEDKKGNHTNMRRVGTTPIFVIIIYEMTIQKPNVHYLLRSKADGHS